MMRLMIMRKKDQNKEIGSSPTMEKFKSEEAYGMEKSEVKVKIEDTSVGPHEHMQLVDGCFV